MRNQFTATLILLSLLTQTALSANKISLKERKLPAEEVNSVQATLGAGAFLLGFLVHGLMTESDDGMSAEEYNPLFFNIIKEHRTKELELLVTYMKTYQKDLNNACRIVFNIKKNNYEPVMLQKLKARCDLWTAQVFKLIPLNHKFFNIEFAFKYFYYLHKSRAIPIEVMLGEATDPALLNDADEETRLNQLDILEKAKVVNQIFMIALSKIINETLRGEDSIVHSRFHLIQRFYGPEFIKIFKQILDDKYKVIRKTIELDEFEQEALDTMFMIPADRVREEKERIEKGSHPRNINYMDLKSVSPGNLYRFYGNSFDKPFNDVGAMYMMDM